MILESARRFSDAIMLQVIEIDHVQDFWMNPSKIIATVAAGL
jgi:hypothetical protein